ncbi:hypothetical protein ACQJBY_055978 [Aegilops geniculata]
MGGKRKNRAGRKTPSLKGRQSRKSVAATAAAPSPVAIETPEPATSSVMVTPSPVGTVAVSAAWEVKVNLDFDVPVMVLNCDVCHHLLKAPIFQCSLLRHVVCRSCSEVHGGKCRPCADMAASAVYVQSSYLDTLFGFIKTACVFEKYGCTSSAAFGYPAITHALSCAFLPRSCPKCSFKGTLGDLVRHLAEEYGRHEHDWTAQKITYGQEYLLNVVEQDPLGVYDYDFFVAEEDGGVFLLFSDLTEDFENSIFPSVTLVCVRNGAAAAAGPAYSYWVAAEAPSAVRRPEINEVLSISDWDLERDCLPLLPGMRQRMRMCISKAEGSSASC